MREASIARGGEALVLGVQHAHPGVARGVGVAHGPAPVGRAVVHEQYVQVLVVLGEDAVEALGEVALHVVHENRGALLRAVR